MSHALSRRSVAAMLTVAALPAGVLALAPAPARAQEARAILRAAFDNWRAESSHAVVTMTVKRAGAPRKLAMESWTHGKDRALVRFTAPARDAGNATLQLGASTYVFNPRLNQVIKLPASAMSQSWMGSDFSYDDLSRSEKVIDDFTHTLLSATGDAYVIESVPKRGKPVIWGKEVLTIRKDGVLMQVEYYDQVGERVRVMKTEKVGEVGGRAYPVVMTMRSDAKPDRYTQITTKSAEFNIPVPSYMFTKSNLQNPRN